MESEAIADKLKNLGVDYVQGYAIGEPVPLVVPPAHYQTQTYRAAGKD